MSGEIVKADNHYRKILFTAYLLTLLIGAAFWKWILPLVLHHLSSLPNKERFEATEAFSHTVLLLFVPAALYVISIGRKVCRYKAMPYPGMRVIHDTVVITDKKALFRGKCMIVLGTTMIVLVVISIVSTHCINLRFKHHPLFHSVFYGSAV